jgi:hypothetical protein
MKQIAVIGFKKIECFCYWAKYKMGFELENREHKNVWINKKEQMRYIGIFDAQDFIGRHFDDYIEVDEVRLDLYERLNKKPRTNFDKITESVDAFIKWVLDTYHSVPEQIPCKTSCNNDCEECFKKWLQKEIEE